MHGIIIGKFVVFHYGHKYLIDTASSIVKKLTVFVCTLKNEKIDGTIRYNWLKETYKNSNISIIHIQDEIPDAHRDNGDNAYKIWINHIVEYLPTQDKKIDLIISSEQYSKYMSEYLNCNYLILDINREIIPSSSTAILENPLKNWSYITEIAREHFVKVIAIDNVEYINMLSQHFYTKSLSPSEPYFIEKLVAVKKQANRFIFVSLNKQYLANFDLIFIKNDNKNTKISNLIYIQYESLDGIIEEIKNIYLL